MKKFLVVCFLLVSFAIVGSPSQEVHANVKEGKSVEQAYLDAKNGVSDLSVEEMKQFGNFGLKSINGSELDGLEIEEYITAQVLKDDGQTKTILVSTFSDVSILADETKTGTKTDDTLSVRAFATVQFRTSTIKGIPHVSIVGNVTGGWTILDSQVSLSNRFVSYGNGTDYSANYPSGNAYSYVVPTSWSPAVIVPGYGVVGSSSSVTLNRGGSTWQLAYSIHY